MLQNNIRITRNMIAEVVRERDTVFVIRAARAVRNDDLDRLTLVSIATAAVVAAPAIMAPRYRRKSVFVKVFMSLSL